MVGAEGKKWPGTAAETKFAEYLVRTAGAHFVTVVRRGVGELLGVRVPGQTFVAQELMEAASKAEPSDGRPCSMDVFAAALFDECDDHYDCADAIKEWLHGGWKEALSYLEDETIKRIAPDFAFDSGGEA